MRHNPYATATPAHAGRPTPLAGRPAPDVALRRRLDRGQHQARREAGAAGVTYYETTGWRGVMETAAGSPVPDKFVSIPARSIPSITCWPTTGIPRRHGHASRSADRLAVDGLALRRGDDVHVVLANLTDEAQRVVVQGGVRG